MGKIKDLTGQRFGFWTVLERAENKNKATMWLCECICKTKREVNSRDLVSGHSTNCGCQRAENLIGKRFGKLIVIERKGSHKHGGALWLCKCDCGNYKEIATKYLKNGTKSCGCITKNRLKKYNIYDLSNDYGIGYTAEGEKFFFDLNDFNKIKNYYWQIHKRDEYVCTKDEDKIIYMHRLICDVEDDNIEIDHKNHIKYDNRKSINLRITTKEYNLKNKLLYKNNTSGERGVRWDDKENKWIVTIHRDKEKIRVGCYDNFDDAVKIRKLMEERYYKEFSFDNSQKLSNKDVLKGL